MNAVTPVRNLPTVETAVIFRMKGYFWGAFTSILLKGKALQRFLLYLLYIGHTASFYTKEKDIMPSHNSLRQQLLKRCTNHPLSHNDVSSEVQVPQNLIAEALLCLVSSIIQNLIHADIQRQRSKWYRVAALFLRKLKMCTVALTMSHSAHM